MSEASFDTEKDRLFSVGDIIDRGPDSPGMIKLLTEPWFFAVRGNHEEMMLASFSDMSARRMWLANGGEWSHHYDISLLQFWSSIILEEMPIAMTIELENGKIGITHAEPPVDWNSAVEHPGENVMKYLWSRNKVLLGDSSHCLNISRTYHGHTPASEIRVCGNSHFIDLDPYFRGEFELIRIDNENF